MEDYWKEMEWSRQQASYSNIKKIAKVLEVMNERLEAIEKRLEQEDEHEFEMRDRK